MFCPACGVSVAAGVALCPACGAAMRAPSYRAPQIDAGGKAIASLVLGILGLVVWILPIIGLPVTIIGVVQGAKALHSRQRGMAIAGLILSVIGLVAAAINAAIGAYLGVTGQHSLGQ